MSIKEAIKYYVKASSKRGDVYYKLREYDKAILDYSKVIEIEHNDGLAYFNRW